MVDPPVRATEAMAFSSASQVTICLGRRSSATRRMTMSPARWATSSLSGSMAGTALALIGDTPSNLQTVDILLTVNCPPHAPGPGQAQSSRAQSCASVILTAACEPTTLNTSWIVTSCPSHWPGAIEPPYRINPGMSNRTSAITPPEIVLSHPTRIARPSKTAVARHQLDRVGHHLPAHERRVHPFAAHRDAIGDRHRVELHQGPPPPGSRPSRDRRADGADSCTARSRSRC